jgi:hypothetical protein
MTGFAVNHKLSFPKALGSLQIAGLNVSRRREIILKSNVVLMSVTYTNKDFLKNKVQKLFEVMYDYSMMAKWID